MSHKQSAQDFLLLCSRGDSREAFAKYAAEHFKHHNPYFKGDAQTLILAMEDAALKTPNKVFAIQRTIEDGDLVAVHSFIQRSDDDPGMVVVHICRFEGDRIAELWDVVQIVPDEVVNEEGVI